MPVALGATKDEIRKFPFAENPSQSPFKKGRGFTPPPLEKGVPKAGDFNKE